MKLSKQDLRIIMAIRKEEAPMANYQIAKRLGIHPAQTFKRLRQMANNRVLHVTEGYPKFYNLNSSNGVQNFIVQTIECPSCKMLHIRHQSQTTIQCLCKTSSGKFRRFYIYNSRIKSKKVLTMQHEEEKPVALAEKENDVQDMMKNEGNIKEKIYASNGKDIR